MDETGILDLSMLFLGWPAVGVWGKMVYRAGLVKLRGCVRFASAVNSSML